ncbi:2-oxoglutarate-dependent dioxygenase AOP3-like [Pyrus ussuriensis x Pyrus communis]|uniref:2-oxoglutarate-dependent dioxygenase AOP3-like n=1 Tax=Pyrus ussuriensis x Pyrus communis TaxID=2448454 RepID=A0A5N5GSB4_9ROSA|nr:2-oxoglutarate-dependent dioxygenase AOP3-like [Pyrus ussuriensis x Pyrus communis]
MRSESQSLVVPVVDLSNENMKPGTDAWLLACKQVQHALEEFCCFEVVYNKVTLETHNSIFSAIKDLCDLPLETKMQKTSDKPLHNYFGQNPLFPYDFSSGIENPATVGGVQKFTSIMWPEGNERFRESVRSFSEMMVELDQMVTRMVFDIYGVGRLYDSQQASTTYQLRCIGYEIQNQTNESNVRLFPHTDKCFTTIQHQSEVNGLQIKTKAGQWIDYAPSSPSSFIVFASDILMAWSNDRVCACEHRVILKEMKTRYSVSLFSYKNGIVQVPEELVDNKHPLRYKPFDHFDFLRFYLTEEGQKAKHAIKAYCGI